MQIATLRAVAQELQKRGIKEVLINDATDFDIETDDDTAYITPKKIRG